MPSPIAVSPDVERRAFPLQDYAAIGDGRSIAILAPDGAVVWWGVPNIDSEPLFDSLLDAEAGGFFTVAPTEPFEVERRYRQDSNVLESVITTANGSAVMTESMNSSLAGRLPWCELARRVEVRTGWMTFRAHLVCGTHGDALSPWLQPNRNGCIFHVGPVLGLLRVSPHVEFIEEDDRKLLGEVTLVAGERALFAVVAGSGEPLGVPPIEQIDERVDLSDTAWRNWAEAVRYDGPHRERVRRSALALKLLLFSPSGAIAAAATTSLPERIGGPKNYDYRYAWVRDAAYSLAAFLRIGVVPEAKAALTWLIQRLGETGAKVCFKLDGSPVPALQELERPGYRDSRPVVVGNVAAEQHQHGIYGDILQATALFVRCGNVLDGTSAAILSKLVDECADRWRQKDAGIWELEEPQHYTMSKISCWQALARAVELAEDGHLPTTCVERWTRERDRVAAWVEEHCWSEERQAFTFYPGTDRLDAALVLAARFGFDGRDRLSATCDAIRRELGQGPWLHRYTGAQEEEGAFLACSFWMVEALASLGRLGEAEEMMAAILSGLPAGTGVMAEMIDTGSGDLLGNLPQGLSHLALIHAACSIEEARGGDDAAGRLRD